MSYILDALKKAEADRDPDARASLAMAQHERRRNRWLAYAAVIALIANAAILLWLFLPESAGPDHQVRGFEIPPRDQPTSMAPSTPVESAPAYQAPVGQSAAVTKTVDTATTRPSGTISSTISSNISSNMAAESATGETIIGPNTGPAPAATPLPVSSLPGGQRGRFPALKFSTHIYADDADLRAIVVNGTRLEEGDRFGNLRLHEITEDGAVFRFENQLVSVSVLDDWE